jgi:NitT/TauT family transport system permease protein
MASKESTTDQDALAIRYSPTYGDINQLLEYKKIRYALSTLLLLSLWQFASIFTSPTFLPSPFETLLGIVELVQEGTLQSYILLTGARVFAGWLVGSIVAIAIGWGLGYSDILRKLFEPYINFFRGLPAIIWISVAVIWLGYGPVTRIALVAYAVCAVIVVDALDSVLNVQEERIRAARSMGASPLEAHIYVRIPSSVPEVFTALRVGLGISAMTIVAVEMLISSSGIGYLVWISRTYLKPSWVFAGVVALGSITYIFNFILRFLGRRYLGRFGVRE